MENNINIEPIDREFTICKINDISVIDFSAEYCFVGKTDEELSLVCETLRAPQKTEERSDGWRAFRIAGVLDFSLTGILSGIALLLAENKIPIFAVSTYNTDYVFVKNEYFDTAMGVLIENGYNICI